jgi:5-methylcytosine-specific restriction endonuclease McrA
MKKTKKSRVEKPFNAGTMSRAAFWSMIRSALRQRSVFWKPVDLCKKAARRASQSSNKRLKFEYQCNICKNWFPDKQVNVDHIIPAGTLRDYNDLPGFVQRLFVEVDGLQCLCETCHNKKTAQEKVDNKKEKDGQ